jgi:hypothetical protein
VSKREKRPAEVKSVHSPTEALITARALMQQGLFHIGRVELPSELTDLGYPGNDLMRDALCAALGEARTEHCRIDSNPHYDSPAHIFIWESQFFGRRMYLKFKLKGTRKKPVLWLYSCHEAYF